MKLELKHLAPYLPYGLKYVTQSGKIFKSECKDSFEIRIIKGNSPQGNKQYHSLTLGKIRKGLFKPILRVLSDLTKEIEEGKPMFFPSHQLIKHIEQQKDIFNCSYSEIDYLIRNHFDVFGLIEKGLAIDINTL
tara:strand:- start:2406 stop:2807 length:402 start_codon:yes stop_codon:yes gene_type:complete